MTNANPAAAETECRCCGEPTTETFGPGLCGQCAEEIARDLDALDDEDRWGTRCCPACGYCGRCS
jgi:hypothetical protein